MIPGFFAAGSFGASSVGTNYFVENGSNKSFYTSATFPAAAYDSGTNKTWIAYEAWGVGRLAMVTYYDHATGEYGPSVRAGLNPLLNDSHGMPAIVRDASGYLHIFYGAHNDPMRYSVSASANSNASWVAKSDITGDYTYPTPVLVGSDIYLFMREYASGPYPLTLRTITSITAGSGTVGSEIVIAHPGTTDRFYQSAAYAVGTDIHMVGTISNNANTDRADLYYLIYDTTNGSVKNHDGSTTVLSGALPVDRTSLDANFRIVTTAATTGTQAGFCFDSSGNPHVAWLDGTAPNYDVNHMLKSGGSWSSPTTVTTTDTGETPLALVPIDSGAVELWMAVDPTAAWTVGGDMARATRPSGGPWGSMSVVLAASGRALFHPTPVVNGVAGARLMFDEIAQTDTDGDADNKIYLRSDSGYVRRGVQAAATQAILDAFTVPASDARATTIDRLVFNLEEAGIWAKLDAFWMMAAHDAAAALVNWKNPGTHDLTLHGGTVPTFTTDGYYETNGTNGYIDTNFNPATAGGNYTQNAAMFGLVSDSTAGVDNSAAGWHDGTDGVTIRPRGAANNLFSARVNSASSYSSATVTTARGSFIATRSNATTVQNYVNGSLHGVAGTVASTALNSANLRIGAATAVAFAAIRVRAAFVGGLLTATEVQILNDALVEYFESLL